MTGSRTMVRPVLQTCLTPSAFGATIACMTRIGLATAALAAVGILAAFAAAAPPPAAPVTARTISYGGEVELRGKSPVAFKVRTADVLSRPCQITQFAEVGRPTITADGTFTFRGGPTLNTFYRVLVADRQVMNVRVFVKPTITVQRVNGSVFHVAVTTGNGAGLGGKSILLQQRSGRAWRTVGSVKLKLISPAGSVDAVAAGNGRASLRGTGSVRAFLTAGQAKPCFAASVSAPASY